jgi:hypothetical protein
VFRSVFRIEPSSDERDEPFVDENLHPRARVFFVHRRRGEHALERRDSVDERASSTQARTCFSDTFNTGMRCASSFFFLEEGLAARFFAVLCTPDSGSARCNAGASGNRSMCRRNPMKLTDALTGMRRREGTIGVSHRQRRLALTRRDEIRSRRSVLSAWRSVSSRSTCGARALWLCSSCASRSHGSQARPRTLRRTSSPGRGRRFARPRRARGRRAS